MLHAEAKYTRIVTATIASVPPVVAAGLRRRREWHDSLTNSGNFAATSWMAIAAWRAVAGTTTVEHACRPGPWHCASIA